MFASQAPAPQGYHQAEFPVDQPAGAAHQGRGQCPTIGQPMHFATGQFEGRTIRAELHEVQKADLGRKYARVDRRPLDPPPVVQLKLFHVYNRNTDQESESEVQNYDEVQSLGYVCNVDLFPVPGTDPPHAGARDSAQAKHSVPANGTSPYISPGQRQAAYAYSTSPMFPSSSQPSGSSLIPLHVPQPSAYQSPPSPKHVVHHLGDFPITEESKLTPSLVGATFVQPSNVDLGGRKAIVFVFADLAVKIEGTFILRYRVFDIFSKVYGCSELAMQAECYGGPFRVYSTKEFPGLQASTDLTKQLARYGVRLNIRETERKRRKKGELRSVSPPFTTETRRRTQPARRGSYGSDDG